MGAANSRRIPTSTSWFCCPTRRSSIWKRASNASSASRGIWGWNSAAACAACRNVSKKPPTTSPCAPRCSKRGASRGSAALFDDFAKRYREALDPKAFFQAKVLEMRQRHAKFQDTPYSLEPNIKESPGGLRDLQLILWITQAAGFRQQLARTRSARPDHRARGARTAPQRKLPEGAARAAACDRRPSPGHHGVRPANAGGRELRLQADRHQARERTADAPLLLGRQGRHAARHDPDPEHRGAAFPQHERHYARAVGALRRKAGHAGDRQRRRVPARAERDPRSVPAVRADARREGPVGAHAARDLQRARRDGPALAARSGKPAPLHGHPEAAGRHHARVAPDEPDQRARALSAEFPAHRRADAARSVSRLHGRPAHPDGAAQSAPLRGGRACARISVLQPVDRQLRPAVGAVRGGAVSRYRQRPRRRPFHARHGRRAALLPQPRHRGRGRRAGRVAGRSSI